MCKVSIVIPNYNYSQFIGQAIDSVLEQTSPAHEIIVVDDGSSDNSLSILRGYGDQIRLIQQTNQGVGLARNRGADAATGDFIAFLDADDYWAPNKLERQMSKFAEDPDFGVVGCGVINVNRGGQPLGIDLDGSEGWVSEKILMFEATIPANTLMVRKEVFENVGGFDPRKDMHPSEDWDLCYRISRLYKFGYIPEPLFYYRHHGKGAHTNIARMERAMLLGFEKAFAEAAPVSKTKAYGNLYRILSGSYFGSRQYGGFLRNAAKSIAIYPKNIWYFLAFPKRKLQRNR